MTEREMEDLLWEHPEKFLNEQLTQFQRQPATSVGRADVIFTDRPGRFLVIEIKRGKLERGAVTQLHDYFGMLKSQYTDKAVELMVIANHIPPERRLTCEQYDIEAREISEKQFRDVAAEVGYVFSSETAGVPQELSASVDSNTKVPTIAPDGFRQTAKVEKGWYFWRGPNKKGYFWRS